MQTCHKEIGKVKKSQKEKTNVVIEMMMKLEKGLS